MAKISANEGTGKITCGLHSYSALFVQRKQPSNKDALQMF